MFVFKAMFCSVLSIITLFLLTKLMGARQLSELSLFDYVNGITIGSIAAELAISTSLEKAGASFVAMIIYGVVTVLISYFTDKSIILREFISGKPLILMYDEELYYNNFKKARIDMSEFLIRARNNGFFDLDEISTAIFEPNGKVSFLPKSEYKTVAPSDLNLSIDQSFPAVNVIMDGKIIKDNLAKIDKGEIWLLNKLKENKINDINNVFLASVNNNCEVKFYCKNKKKNTDGQT